MALVISLRILSAQVSLFGQTLSMKNQSLSVDHHTLYNELKISGRQTTSNFGDLVKLLDRGIVQVMDGDILMTTSAGLTQNVMSAGGVTGANPIPATSITYNDALVPPALGTATVQGAIDLLKQSSGGGGGGTAEIEVLFSFDDASPVVLQALSPGDVFYRAAVRVTTPFDDPGAALSLGTSTDPGFIFAPGDVDLSSTRAFFDAPLFEPIEISDLFLLSLSPGNSTRGAGVVLYRLQQGSLCLPRTVFSAFSGSSRTFSRSGEAPDRGSTTTRARSRRRTPPTARS